MQRYPIKIGARQSRLAQAMANEVKQAILQKVLSFPDANLVQLQSFVTKGDKIQDQTLLALGGKGLFTAEIEAALLEGRIDIAVHSAKDMPAHFPEGLSILGYLPREDLRDGFISYNGKGFFDLPKGSVIGTAALRRQALIKKLRPDLRVTLLRGNVDTRLKKVQAGLVDGTFLAMSGLKRLGLETVVQEVLEIDQFPPAPGQGAICLQIRTEDKELAETLTPILDQNTAIALNCERSFLAKVEGSCRTPLACYAHIYQNELYGHAQIFSQDGTMTYEAKAKGACGQAEQLGNLLAEEVKYQAGEAFFAAWHR